jgi:hypothetical protein
MKILFISDYKYEIKDGIWAAINLLGYDKYNIGDDIPNFGDYDFILGHGAFHSKVDLLLRSLPYKKGLCIAGNVYPQDTDCYDVLFYETEWVKNFLNLKGNLVHAFGINSKIFNNEDPTLWRYKLIDYLSVGTFATWKRHDKLISVKGNKVCVGDIQKDNIEESMNIINQLLSNEVGVIPRITSDELVRFYHSSINVYIPATIYGGGERAALEARACGCNVTTCDDNDKLKELLISPIWDENYYANQIKHGIETYGRNV